MLDTVSLPKLWVCVWLPGRVKIEKGEENCGRLIEAHLECMRALGFKI
nr:PREDICTED: cytochrome c oxidase copper chaperone [Opisthocomus hoazin]